MTKLKIAICGGGIASLCLAHGLTHDNKHNIEVKIFEASSERRDESAAIGLGSNAQEGLALISPSLKEALDEAGATQMNPSVRVMMGVGPERGCHVGDIAPKIPQRVVHRASLWQALHRRIPADVIEMGKKLNRVGLVLQDEAESVRLYFEDGTSYDADALVGCDGINSVTRQFVAGDQASLTPVWSDSYNHRIVVPLDTAVSVLGKEYCDVKTQMLWVGRGGMLITDFNGDGDAMQLIAGPGIKEDWSKHPGAWVERSEERLAKDLEDWGEIGQKFVKIFAMQPKIYACGKRTHPEVPFYCRGPVCLAGDAAQSVSPAQGAGAGMAIEDALILSAVLGACSTKQDIPRAFQVYNDSRHPRRIDVARSSRWSGMLLTGNDPEVGHNIERMAVKLKTWGSNVYEYDLVAAKADALSRMLIRTHRADNVENVDGIGH